MKRSMEALALASMLVAGIAAQALAVGTPAGTDISNQATVDYEDTNGNPFTAVSNIVTTTVSQVAAVQVAPDNASNAAPGDTLYYAHTVTNLGNAADLFDMTAASSRGWTTAVFQDVDGNGTYDAGTDVALADTDGDLVPDTGSLAADDSLQILVRLVIPAGTTDGTSDVTTVTGTSDFDNTVSDIASDITTVQAGDLTVVKSVTPAGPQPPGTELTYTVTVDNSGTGDAMNVVLTDPVPASTTYVAGSIRQDSNPRTDAGGDDNADYNVTNPGQVTVSIGTLAPAGLTTIEFRVTID